MAIHKIQLDDFASTNYELYAIHSSLDNCRLAYFLNKKLALRLAKYSSIELNTKNGKSFFNHFWYDDVQDDVSWHLIDNKSNLETQPQTSGFFNAIAAAQYLVPEYKKADYILKIDNTDTFFDTNEIVKKLQTIEQIVLLYTIETNKLKSKNNLIF